MNHIFSEHDNQIINSNSEFQKIIDSIDNDYLLSTRKMTHEFGNALTLINSSLQIIESSHPEVKDYKYWPETISDVHYLINLLSELSLFNNTNKLNLQTTDLYDMLQTILNTYKNTDKTGKIMITLSSTNTIPCIIADATKLKQVFINLIKNAFEAIDSTKENPYINIELSYNNNSIYISISDNGCGIPDEHIKEIFNPMVSFKTNGTGLGLAISKKIIDAHKGTIDVISTVGSCTTFIISLPV